MSSLDHISYITDTILTSERVVSLLLITLSQPVSFLLVLETEFDFLKFYHNWANCLSIIALALMINAS